MIQKRLYNRPTACNEPSRLYQKQWDDVSASEFACKPDITIPFSGRVFGAKNVDATLACEVMGSPVPYVKWVIDGRIINNNSHPQPFADQGRMQVERRLENRFKRTSDCNYYRVTHPLDYSVALFWGVPWVVWHFYS